jgi:cyclopropane fatty-acyl-phospholipid synthase-like methyltransferase
MVIKGSIMGKNKLYEKYFESVYGKSNKLTNDEYENAGKDFERLYGKILDTEEIKKVLDVGCGTGHFLYYLKSRGIKNFIGVDISDQQIAFCKSKITEKVKKADIFNFLKDKKNKYDFILANDFLEHLKNEKVYEFLDLVYESLENNGIFTLRVPNMSNPLSVDSRYRDFTHLTGYTEKSIFQLLRTVGFQDIKISSSNCRIKSFKSSVKKAVVLLLHKFIKLLYYIQDFTVPKHLGKNLIVICKK